MIPCNYGFNLTSILECVKGDFYDKLANNFQAEIGLMVPIPSCEFWKYLPLL